MRTGGQNRHCTYACEARGCEHAERILGDLVDGLISSNGGYAYQEKTRMVPCGAAGVHWLVSDCCAMKLQD